MKERPILFSAPMVRALLDGSKTQTRRVVKGAEKWPANAVRAVMLETRGTAMAIDARRYSYGPEIKCPYGKPGDRLWVRENGWERPERTQKMMREGADTWAPYYFDADGISEQDANDFKAWGFKRRPSIHMPRWASRITLDVTSVRVERLQDISHADAKAEGIFQGHAGRWTTWSATAKDKEHLDPVEAYRDLWGSINSHGSWDANPRVWVVEFKRSTP